MTWFTAVPWSEVFIIGSSVFTLKSIPETVKKIRKDLDSGMYADAIRKEILIRGAFLTLLIVGVVYAIFHEHNLAWFPWFAAQVVDDSIRLRVHWKGYKPAIAREILTT